MNALKKVLLSLSCLAVLLSAPACYKDKGEGRKHHVRRYKNGKHEKKHHGMHHEGREHKHHPKHKEKYKKETKINGGKKSTKTMTEEESSY